MITTNNMNTDVLGDLLKSGPQAENQHSRGIYARNTTLSHSDKLTLERAERQSDDKLSREMKIASGEIKLDELGREIKEPVKSPYRYVNEGRDVLGELLRAK